MESATKCGFHLQLADLLQIPQQQLCLPIHTSDHLFVDSTICSGFRKYSCVFRIFAYFWSDFDGTLYWVFVCGIQKKSDFDLLRNPLTKHILHSLAS